MGRDRGSVPHLAINQTTSHTGCLLALFESNPPSSQARVRLPNAPQLRRHRSTVGHILGKDVIRVRFPVTAPWAHSSTDRVRGYEPRDRGSIPCGPTKLRRTTAALPAGSPYFAVFRRITSSMSCEVELTWTESEMMTTSALSDPTTSFSRPFHSWLRKMRLTLPRSTSVRRS